MSEIKMLPLPEDLVGDLYDYEDRELRYRPTRAAIHSAIQDYARAVAEHNVKLATAELHRQFGCELRDPNGTIWDHAAKLQAEIEALRNLCGAAYQLAGVHDAPEAWLDALSAAASGHPFSTYGLLPYMPQAVCEAEAHAERLAEALRLALDSHGKTLLTDPPQDAWKVNRVEEIGRAALRDHDQEGKDG